MLKQDNYIKNLIAQGEHLQQDFKFEISDSRKIARSLVAFANTAGGKLLIGVKDNGAIAGVRSDEEFYMVEAAANMYSQPEIIFKTNEWKVEGKTVLEIDINKSDKMPHYAKSEEGKWLAYIRNGDKNLLVNRIQLQVWKREKFGKPVFLEFRENERLLFDYLDRKKEISLPKLLKLTRMKKQDAEQLLIDLILLQIIEIEFREQITVYKFKEGFDKILEDMRY